LLFVGVLRVAKSVDEITQFAALPALDVIQAGEQPTRGQLQNLV
jgi:hypothetical protein